MTLAEREAPETMPLALSVNGETLLADVSGAAFWEREQALLIADLHMEKGSSYARAGQLLPPYDTAACLAGLTRLAARYRPRTLYFLGDAFHDPFAGERLHHEHYDFFTALGRGADLVWIAGNHDPAPPERLPGERCGSVTRGGLTLVHHPAKACVPGEIAGHLHPVAKVKTRAATLRRRCFIGDGQRLILPAFGPYSGGVNVRDPAIAGLFDAPQVHVIGERRVMTIARDRLV